MIDDKIDIQSAYKELAENYLEPLKDDLLVYLKEWLKGVQRLDRIDARVKTVSSFVNKALKQDDSGAFKYSKPFSEIQDMIGARVVVFFEQDAAELIERAKSEFRYIERKFLVPEYDDAFGYFGYHMICFLPNQGDISANDRVPAYFELQIKTLFQHAWSQLHHDTGYKERPDSPFLSKDKRLSAHASSLAWGADKAFAELYERSFAD